MAGAHSEIEAPAPLNLWRDLLSHSSPLYANGLLSDQWPVVIKQVRRSLGNHYDETFCNVVVTELEKIIQPSIDQVICYIYQQILKQSGKKYLLIKENNLQNYAAQILYTFPNAKFIFQVRDPRDFVSSAKKLRGGRLGNKFGSIYNAINVWKEDQEFGLRMMTYFSQERVYFQRYEDLIVQPKRVLQSLCDFIGIPFDESMLSYHQKNDNVKFANKGSQWKNLSKPIMQSNIGNYKNHLSQRNIKSIEIYLGDLLKCFGYQLEIKPKKTYTRLDILWPRIMHPIEYFSNKISTPFLISGNKAYVEQMNAKRAPLSTSYQIENHSSSKPTNEK